MRTGLREHYRGWFSWWLQQKIAQTPGPPEPIAPDRQRRTGHAAHPAPDDSRSRAVMRNRQLAV